MAIEWYYIIHMFPYRRQIEIYSDAKQQYAAKAICLANSFELIQFFDFRISFLLQVNIFSTMKFDIVYEYDTI